MKKYFTEIEGVFAGGLNCGIKSGKMDLAFFYVPESYSSAGVFTTNKFAADCVNFNRENISKGIKFFVVNSGNANAVTKHAREANNKIAKKAAELLSISESEVGIASTGIIGVELPYEKIISGLEVALKNPKIKSGDLAAKAILTTDTIEKSVFYEAEVAGQKLQIGGICKGAGMISPNMATMLGFVFTNLKISSQDLQASLKTAVDKSFNMVSVDTDTSTNDMVIAISSGTLEADLSDKKIQETFDKLLQQACEDLAKMIARDGEGATKLLEAKVRGASSQKEADLVAKSVINSPLIKTAVHGADPNWGRIIMAIGKVPDTNIVAEKVAVRLQNVKVLEHGFPVAFDRAYLIAELKKESIQIDINLNIGDFEATAWGCDLTHGYIDVNVAYN